MTPEPRSFPAEPVPTAEEAAAIAAALGAFRGEEPAGVGLPKRDRWRLAGLLGHAPPREMKLPGSLWSYSSWEGMV